MAHSELNVTLLGSSFVLATLFSLCRGPVDAADMVLNFEELSLPAESALTGDASETPIISQGVSFNRTWNTEFNCCPGAWALSNRTDQVTAGFENSYSAYHRPAGGGVNGSVNYLVAFDSTGTDAEISLPAPTTVRGTYVANTTYAYLAVSEGRDTKGSNLPAFVKGPFADGDFFQLSVIGVDADQRQTGQVDFFLADYRDGKREVVSSWTWLDLTSLGDQVNSLSFELRSTDVGMFGMNTPSFFAIDDLTLAVPEPCGSLAGFLGLFGLLLFRNAWGRKTKD